MRRGAWNGACADGPSARSRRCGSWARPRYAINSSPEPFFLWAFAHLIANGRLADLLLFGAFLVWSIAGFIAARRRDRFAGTRYPAAGLARDALVLIVGVLAWAAFAFWGHRWLIGVAPFD
ncbi:MAG: hypothetical protein IPH26_21920 [Sterolibacteriaceae bacterium]|uniref:NnrU domain-containing protein n=1 Tax=Candidatus Methylophosphatis roskildensis TaxID=2899263 RepID=A0A9D7E7U2_9PROT|nr:hypothetical protein [Candidatus Methylophosphatis roskildensis]MBK7235547.1 hypothetical protein [Sterolibacteriaceae bacterium]